MSNIQGKKQKGDWSFTLDERVMEDFALLVSEVTEPAKQGDAAKVTPTPSFPRTHRPVPGASVRSRFEFVFSAAADDQAAKLPNSLFGTPSLPPSLSPLPPWCAHRPVRSSGMPSGRTFSGSRLRFSRRRLKSRRAHSSTITLFSLWRQSSPSLPPYLCSSIPFSIPPPSVIP